MKIGQLLMKIGQLLTSVGPLKLAAAAVSLLLVGALVVASYSGSLQTSVPTTDPSASPSTAPESEAPPSPIANAPIVVALPPPAEAPIAAVVASPVTAAATRPPATPTPAPDPKVWRVEGVIVADDTKLPIKEVCIVIGPRGCQRGSIRTDSRGVFFIDVPQIPTVFYDLYFVKDGFWTVWMRIKPEGPSVYNVALTKR
jgi:hypothetical protein